MNKKSQRILIQASLVLFTGTFVTLSMMSFKYGQPSAMNTPIISIDRHEGHDFINQDIVLEKVKELFPTNEKIHATSLSKLENFLQTHPHISRAVAFIDRKGQLHVDINQFSPIVRVFNLNKESYYIDRDMRKVPTSDIYTAKVPILSGYISEGLDTLKNEVQSSILKAMVQVLETVQKDEYWSAQVAQIDLRADGVMRFFPRLGQHEVIIGDETDIEEKLKKLEIFYDKISSQVGWDTFQQVDLQFKNQIVCK